MTRYFINSSFILITRHLIFQIVICYKTKNNLFIRQYLLNKSTSMNIAINNIDSILIMQIFLRLL